jgi:hypothetical protein
VSACVECCRWKNSQLVVLFSFGSGRHVRAGARGAFTSVIPSGRSSSVSGIALELPSSRSCGNKGTCSIAAIVVIVMERGYSMGPQDDGLGPRV